MLNKIKPMRNTVTPKTVKYNNVDHVGGTPKIMHSLKHDIAL